MRSHQPSIAGIPAMGYGTWNRSADVARDGVMWALEAGYRHIDTAQGYDNEEYVGAAIADSGMPRNDIFITTKVAPENYGPGAVRPSVEKSLEKLGVDAVDLLLLHWPSPHRKYPLDVYVGQLAEVLDAGLAGSIGVSNFTVELMTRAASLLGERPIRTNQVEAHVYMQNSPIVDHCRSVGVSTTAYCPLARGAVIGDPVLAGIGQAHGVTGEQVALAFLLAEGHIVIPSSGKKDRILSNFGALDVNLSADEIARLRGLERGQRLVDGAWCPDWDRTAA